MFRSGKRLKDVAHRRRFQPIVGWRWRVFELNLPNVLTLLRILLVPVLVVALLDETANGDLLAAIVFALASFDRRDGRLPRAHAQRDHDVRQAHGPDRRQAADHRGARRAGVAEPSRRVGRDGHHRARADGHGHAHAGHPAGRRHRGQLVGQGEDDRAGRGDLLRHRRRASDAGVGRRPRLRRRRDHDRQRDRLLLRAAAGAARGRGAPGRGDAKEPGRPSRLSARRRRATRASTSGGRRARPSRARGAARRAGRSARRRRCAGGSSRGSPGAR